MSIEGIIKRIQKDSAAEAERIKQQFSAQIAECRQKYESKREKAVKSATEQGDKERARAKQRAIDHQRLMASQKILSKKLELLDSVFELVRKRIESLPPDEYRHVMSRALQSIGENNGTVIVAADKEILNEKFIDIASNLITQSSGNECNFQLEWVDEKWRGFYLKCGKIRYNATIGALLATVREKTEENVITQLFE